MIATAPTTGPRYVFLDQNHWIYLARAILGKPKEQVHVAVAEELLAKVERDEIRLPLSFIHLLEHSGSEHHGQRERLAQIFDQFSRGWFFARWDDILSAEILRAVAQTFGMSEIPEIPQVFVRRLGVLATQPGELLEFLTSHNEKRRIWQKEQAAHLGSANAAEAEKFRAVRRRYSKTIQRRARLVDNYTVPDLQGYLSAALDSIGKSSDDFIALGEDVLVEFWARVPSLNTDCELTLNRDMNWSHEIKPNDVYDIGHLVIALPYCHGVVVERFWANVIRQTRLDKRYSTMVCDDLAGLPGTLEVKGAAVQPQRS